MWTVPTRVVLAADGSSSSSKDGRKINIGDCALFKPPHDSQPFIGVIRSVTTSKENKLKLGVNWLYRPAEVKLGKGIPLDAAPNELFYSFHKDEIPAAALLHPCKVAFLPKGVELPSGTSSFVCWRLYDVTNKCLWWLTDQDYINERQEEVDQLLCKTRVEMHATVQSGGRSPKPTNGPTSTSQVKAGSETMQNSVSSFSSQVKGKKRERAEQGTEPFKRERITKTEDGDSGQLRQENLLKSEIAKITEKGGLVDLEGVERLVQLMLPDRSEKKIDLAGRSMLAGVIAVTDKFDCLSQFVQLRGLPVFDEWLQEVHKGKVGDSNVPKDSDKSVEEFLLVLLRALDKLPVNLQALQMCNIGKSVNHLRSHRNSEIQKKSRSLVDTWKKRVEAEMNINDMKAVAWPGRSRPEVGNRHSGGSSDVAMKSSVAQISGSKSASVKIVHGDGMTRSASVSPGSVKSVPSLASASANLKDGHPRNLGGGGNGMSDVPLTPARDEKSSGSSQSHNNSQSCSNDHARNGGISGKDDARSSSAGSLNANKVSGVSSRTRKSSNGFQGAQSGRNSLQKNLAAEKSLQSGLTSEKVLDGTIAEGNSHNKLIVKIPNRGHSPAQNSGGSFEDPSIMSSRASSPAAPLEKHDQFDRSNSKDKTDAYRATVTGDVNTESWQSNDLKDALTASDEGDGSPAAVIDEERCRTGDEIKKVVELSKTASSSTGNEPKSGNLQEGCFSSMEALIESCVKHSEHNAVDVLGMNLLASVAAGEITDSPQRNATTEIASGSNPNVGLLPKDSLAQNRSPSIDGADDENREHGGDDRMLIVSEEKPVMDNTALVKFLSTDSQKAVLGPVVLASSSKNSERTTSSDQSKLNQEKLASGQLNADDNFEGSNSRGESLLHTRTIIDGSASKEAKLASTALEAESEIKRIKSEGNMKNNLQMNEKPIASVVGDSESGIKVQEVKTEKSETVVTKSRVNESERHRTEPESTAPSTPENKVICGLNSGVASANGEHMERNLEGKEVEKCGEPTTCDVQVEVVKSRGTEEAEECTSTSGDSSSKSADTKVEFDLNEGFNIEDGKYAEPKNLVSGSSLISPLPFPVSSVSSGLPASITVAAAAKGAFVPPSDLLRSKGELGWKGSAATSAFRPAEPRKVVDAPTPGKQGRSLFDFDLNVADERLLDDMADRPVRLSGGLDLDLNEVDEASDMGNYSMDNNRRSEITISQVKPSPSGKVGVRRDFDLNDGPVVDESSAEPTLFGQQARKSVQQSQPSGSGNFSSWFHQSPAYPANSIPLVMPDRGEQQQPFPIVAAGGPQRMMGPPIGGNPYAQGHVLSASASMPPFPSTSFQYPVFSYGPGFSIPTATTTTAFPGGSTTYLDSSSGGRLCFPGVHPQLVGPAGGVASSYPRPYVISLQDGTGNNSKWGPQGLDLNAGPGGAPEVGGIDESSSSSSLVLKQQLHISGPAADEQARMFQKRKEPDGGWDGYKKQSSWH